MALPLHTLHQVSSRAPESKRIFPHLLAKAQAYPVYQEQTVLSPPEADEMKCGANSALVSNVRSPFVPEYKMILAKGLKKNP